MTAIRTKNSKMSVRHSSRRLPAWRNAVVDAFETKLAEVDEAGDPWRQRRVPHRVAITFVFSRPKSHTKAERLCPWRYLKPDVDKLVRAVHDAMEIAGVMKDDARVVDLRVSKRYVDRRFIGPGAVIMVEQIPVVEGWVEKEEA